MATKKKPNATHQAKGTGRGGIAPPKSRQFGQPGGNKQNPGGWKKENSISYQYHRFMNMTDSQFRSFGDTIENEPKKVTLAMVIAYKRLVAARDSLPDVKEITDRTEGKAKESVKHSGDDDAPIKYIIYEGGSDKPMEPTQEPKEDSTE